MSDTKICLFYIKEKVWLAQGPVSSTPILRSLGNGQLQVNIVPKYFLILHED